jgi:hypothetical protein
MALKIVSADERLKAVPKVNIALFGPSGVGKTTQARTLNPESTLFLDGEAGTLALADWRGDVVDMRRQAMEMGLHPWDLARGLACWIGGPDPAADPANMTDPYGPAMYQTYCTALGDPSLLAKYDTIFVDSITVASRWSFNWAQRQPEAMSERTGKPDTRGAYGLHGREMVKWLTMLQHIPGKSIIVVGILDKEVDDLKRTTYSPQIEGSKAGRELPGIFDQVLTLDEIAFDNGTKARAFVCHQSNPWGFPAKDRSGRLELVEEPDLGKLLAKIRNGKRLDQNITTALPAPAEQPAAEQAAPAQATA